MRPEEIRPLLAEHRGELERLNVISLHLFGSVARGEDHLGSDVDVLVDFDGPASFDQFMDLKFLLEDLFDRPVDLVTRKGLRPELAPVIEREAVAVA